jgi:hypothetical protein
MDSHEPKKSDDLLDALERNRLKRQMFDPPVAGMVTVAGRPVFRIPDSEQKYPDFLAWWREIGRLHPEHPQGWSTLSGPGVMWNRTPLISSDQWESLPEEERNLLRQWTDTFPVGMFYD